MRYNNSNMGKILFTKTLARYVAFFVFCSIPYKGLCQTGEDVVSALVKMGFENVGCAEYDKERVYTIQNSAYRLQGVGIAKAVDVIQNMGLPEDKSCRIIVLDNNVPQISLCYRPSENDSLSAATRQEWSVSYDLGGAWEQARKIKKANSSLYKVDIVVYPELSLKNLVITQVYQVLFNLSPAIEVSLWKGMTLTAQMVIPIYNDGYPTYLKKVHPGFVGLSQKARLPYNIWGTLTVGHFSSDRYGVDLQFVHRSIWDERFSLSGRVGYTGAGYWDGFTMHYGTRKRWTWSLGAGFYWPKYNVETTMKVEQYLFGERGVRVDMIRHFRYTSIGFFAMKAKGAKSNGGFRFQIALPPYKYKRRGYIPHLTPSENMGIAYNAGNEQYYYRGYRALPSDNIMRNNSLNPYFIKSELLNF